MMKPTLLALLILGTAATGLFAQDAAAPSPGGASTAADGSSTSPGAPGARGAGSERQASRLATMDADGDGRVTEDEILAALRGKADERARMIMARLDADGNGAIDAAEMQPSAEQIAEMQSARMFARMDSDGDGAISEEEFAAAHEQRPEGRRPGAMRAHGSGRHWGDGEHGERSLHRW